MTRLDFFSAEQRALHNFHTHEYSQKNNKTQKISYKIALQLMIPRPWINLRVPKPCEIIHFSKNKNSNHYQYTFVISPHIHTIHTFTTSYRLTFCNWASEREMNREVRGCCVLTRYKKLPGTHTSVPPHTHDLETVKFYTLRELGSICGKFVKMCENVCFERVLKGSKLRDILSAFVYDLLHEIQKNELKILKIVELKKWAVVPRKKKRKISGLFHSKLEKTMKNSKKQ